MKIKLILCIYAAGYKHIQTKYGLTIDDTLYLGNIKLII